MGVFSKGLVDFKTIIKTAKIIFSHAEKRKIKLIGTGGKEDHANFFSSDIHKDILNCLSVP